MDQLAMDTDSSLEAAVGDAGVAVDEGNRSWELVAELGEHGDRVWQVCWHPSGKQLASCGGDRTVRVWTCESGRWRCQNVLEDAHSRTVRGVSFSPNGRSLATASFDATIGIWEREPGGQEDFECVATLEGHENEAKSVAWSSSGTLLATCSRDKSVWIWEVEGDNDFECLSVLQEHSQDVKMVTWHPHEELLASASYDDTIKFWAEEEDDWYCIATLTGHQSTVWYVDFDRSGENLVSCSDDKSLRLWRRYKSGNPQGLPTPSSKTSKWKLVSTMPDAHGRCIYSVSWSKIHGLIASGGGDAKILIFRLDNFDTDAPSYARIATIVSPHGTADINSVAWNPNPDHADLLATAGDDGVVRVWRLL